ncbi:MAG TPA: hypothetical protein VFL86_02930 [Burkholderiaceae bacterium]|nr:hypothetical protein [Burkholderiaceae bacterium]
MAVVAVAVMVVGVIAAGGTEDGETLAGTVPSAAVEAARAVPVVTAMPSPGPVTADGVPQTCEAVAKAQALPAPDPSALALARQKATNRLASGDAAQRTLALLLQAPPAGDAAQRADWAAQVLASALASSDAPTLRAAASVCPHVTDARGCRLQLIRRRIGLDPGNALPWVEWLDEDPTAANDAWAGLAAASHWRDEPQRLAAAMGRALDPDLPAPVRTALVAEAAIHDAGKPTAALSVVQNHCGHWGPEHPHGIACAHIVTLILTDADSPRTALEGSALARNMGWEEGPLMDVELSARRVLEGRPMEIEHDCLRPIGLHTDKPR